jgi:hypothetical protein
MNERPVLAPATFLAVPPAQFVHQVPEARGQARIFGTQVLLQPFAYRVADRPAGLVINRFAAVVDSAVHEEFRLASVFAE